MFRVVWRIMKKEFIQAVRDKRMLAVLLIAPLLQTVLFGFALNLDLTAQPLLIVDQDRSVKSRELVDAVTVTDGFVLAGYATDRDEAENAILRGKAVLAVYIPRGFEQDLSRGKAEVQVIVDGSDSNTALRSSQEVVQVLNDHVLKTNKARIMQTLLQQGIPAETVEAGIEIAPRAWFNPQLRSAVFMVPGVLGLVLMVITMVLTSMGLTREKEIGTLEQIMVSPIRPWQLIIGKILPFSLFGLADVTFIVSLMTVVFNVPPMGSLLELLLCSVIFLMTTLGLGLFISTISETQQQAMLTAFFVLLPVLMLSGIIFPVDHLPGSVQWIADINPLRYYIALVRGIVVKGANLADMREPFLWLTGLGLLVFSSATLRFRKRSG